jgi:hypothetical protein
LALVEGLIVEKFSSEEEFVRYAEEQSLKFRESYGLRPGDPLTDEVMARALEDYDLPRFEDLADSPVVYSSDPVKPRIALRSGVGRRERASHLLAHAIVHGGQRCRACEEW